MMRKLTLSQESIKTTSLRLWFRFTLTLCIGWGFFVCPVFAVAPVNDNVASAIWISSPTRTLPLPISYKDYQNTVDASMETGEYQSVCGWNNVKSVWYKYITTTAVTIALDTIGSDYNTVVQVSSGQANFSSHITTSPIGTCDDYSGDNDTSKLSFVAFKNTTYYIQITCWNNGAGGNLVFSASMTAVASDESAPTIYIQQPTESSLNIISNFTTISGTASDNVGVTQVEIRISSGDSKDWDPNTYNWTASTPFWSYTNVGNYGSTTTSWERSSMLPSWTNNATYYIYARAKDAAGNIGTSNPNGAIAVSSVAITLPSAPGNDTIEGATLISYLNFSGAANTANAVYATEKTGNCGTGNRDVWWVFKPTFTTTVEVVTSTSDFDRILTVWDSTGTYVPPEGGGRATPSSQITCSNIYYGNSSTVTVNLQAGTTYFFQYCSWYSAPGGNLSFQINRLAGDSTPPSAISNLIVMEGGSPGTVKLEWSAPGDDGAGGGMAAAYDVRYSTLGPIISTSPYAYNGFYSFWLSSGVHLSTDPPVNAYPAAPVYPGGTQNLWLYNLPQSTMVWFAILTRDEAYNWSALSNEAHIFVSGGITIATSSSPVTAKLIASLPFDEVIKTTGCPTATSFKPYTCSTWRSTTSVKEVWYKYAATEAVSVSINTFGSDYDTLLQVWLSTNNEKSGDLGAFTNIACSDDVSDTIEQSKASVNLSVGNTYYIQVVDPTGIGGTLRFQASPPDNVPPGQITSLTASPGISTGSIDLSWLAPGDNGYEGSNVNFYLIKISTHGNISGSNWNSSSTVKSIESLSPPRYPPQPAPHGTLQPLTINDLLPGVTYYFAICAYDTSGNASQVSNCAVTFSKSNPTAAGDGSGTASISPTSAYANEITWSTITFTVGNSTIEAGGAIEVTIPEYWGWPQITNPPSSCGDNCWTGNYFATAAVTAGSAQLYIYTEYPSWPERPKIIVQVLPGARLLYNNKVAIYYQAAWSQTTKQNGVVWKVRSRAGPIATNSLKEIAASPTMNVVGGSAKFAGFSSWDYLTLSTGQASPPLYLKALDSSWQETTMPSPVPSVRIFTLKQTTDYYWIVDPNAQISNNNFSTLLSTFQIASGHWLGTNATYYMHYLSEPFYYRTTSTGTTALMGEYLQEGSWGGNLTSLTRINQVAVSTNSFWRNFSIAAGAALTISSFSIQPTAITPDGDGSNDYASIKFNFNNSQISWRVKISSDVSLTQPTYLSSAVVTVLDWSGWGDPYNNIPMWYGMNNMGQVVPNGNYYVRAEDYSSIACATGVINVESASIVGTVKKGTVWISGAGVTVQGGSSSGGYVYRYVPTEGGTFTVRGLKNNVQYQIFATYYDTVNYKSYSTPQYAVTAPQTNYGITFGDPTQIIVSADVPTAPAWDQWGNVNAYDSSGIPQAWGSLRFAAGSTISDPGWTGAGQASSLTVLTVNAGVYNVRAEMWGYGPVDTPVTAVAGQTVYVSMHFTKKPNIYGNVILSTSSLQQWGTWISVEGVRSGQYNPTIWGGAYFQGNQQYSGSLATAPFMLFGAEPSQYYTIKARGQGIGVATAPPVSVGAGDYGTGTYEWGQLKSVENGVNLIFGTISQGVGGTITVEGNTSNLPTWMKMDENGQVSQSSFTLWVNVWSPTNYSFGNTKVTLSISSWSASADYRIPGLDDGTYQICTWLDGFEIDPPGPQIVTLVNGSGTRNIKLKQYNGGINAFITGISTSLHNQVSLNVSNDYGQFGSGGQVYFSTTSISASSNPLNYDDYDSSAIVKIRNLGTGFYRVQAANLINGQEVTKRISVTNGYNSDIVLDLSSATTCSLSGKVTVQNLQIGVGTNTVTISSAAGFVAVTANSFETVYIGTGNFVRPVARIEAYERDLTDFGQAMGDMASISGTAGFSGTAVKFGFGKVKYGVIDSTGNYRIDNLTPGVYVLRHPIDLDPLNYNGPELASEEKTVLIRSTDSYQVLDPSGGDLNFTFESGSSVNGTVKLPSDVTSENNYGVSLSVKNSRGEVVSWKWLQFSNSNQISYTIDKLANGSYTIEVMPTEMWDSVLNRSIRKYVAKPLSFTLPEVPPQSKDIQLLKPGSVKGKLATEKNVAVGTTTVQSLEVVTKNNVDILPGNLHIYAKANPWIQGGWAESEKDYATMYGGGSPKPKIDSDGYFWITGLIPDTDYDVQIKQDSYDAAALGKGSLNYVPVTKTGIRVGSNQIIDVGTIQLAQGISVNGQVKDASGSTIANLKVRAMPAGLSENEGYVYKVEAYTNEKGSYTLSGLSYDLRYYDIIAAPRERPGEGMQSFDPFNQVQNRYAQSTKPSFDVRRTTETVDFQLSEALGKIIGVVKTPDNKPLSLPFGDKKGYPVAMILANKEGDIPRNNPLGDIEIITNTDGTFTIDRLEVGKNYRLYAMSQGYGMATYDANSISANTNIGTMTLAVGLTISGTIVKPDSTKPSEDEISAVLASNADFSKIAVGTLETNSDTKLIDGYSVTGIESNTAYHLVLLLQNDEMLLPKESAINISTNTQNYKLTFANTEPVLLVKAKKKGKGSRSGQTVDRIEFTIESPQPLRNKTTTEGDDNYWSILSTITSSGSTPETDAALRTNAEGSISANRKKVVVTYTPVPGVAKVTLQFSAPTSMTKPDAPSDYFTASITYDFYTGLSSEKKAKISVIKGGQLKMDDEATSCEIPAGALKNAAGGDLDVSSSVTVGLQKAEDVASSTSAVKGAPCFGCPEAESNLPPILARAVKSMRQIQAEDVGRKASGGEGIKGAPYAATSATGAAQVAQAALGSFYDFFLPAGIRRSFAKTSKVSLAYSTYNANMNVYFFNDTGSTVSYTTSLSSVPPNCYGKVESPTIDQDNKTIMVSVDHFTVFVVVNSTQLVLGADITPAGSATTTAFNKSAVNLLTLTLGTTMTVTGIPVSGGSEESHELTLISTGTSGTGIILNVHSVLQTLNVVLNQESLIDLNSDNLKDISLKVTGITGNQAQVSLAGMLGLTLPDTMNYTGTEIEAFNFPNPFNATVRGFLFTGTKTTSQQTLRAEGSTAIRYALPSNLGAGPVHVSLKIYDVAGDLVKRLDFAEQTTGKYHYGDWDGKNENGDTVASGVYMGQLVIDGSSRSKFFKMAVIK